MYFTPGYNPNEIGDFDVVEHDGKIHCFYLSLPSHDQVGHLVSDDGLNWKPLPFAISTGAADAFDGDQIWTMCVFRKRKTWFMLYTALAHRGLMQTIGLATSDDLISWTKHASNPVLCADARWYESQLQGEYRVDWRDPHVVEHNGKLHGFLCARRHEGLLNRRGCAAYFTSDDGYQWQVHAPAATPSDCFDWECPSVFSIGDKWYMAAIAGGPNRMVYRIAEHIEGPYLRPADDTLLPGANMSVRPCRFRGETHLFHWQRGMRNWGNGGGYAMLASPKSVRAMPNGLLQTESCDWKDQYKGPSVKATPHTPATSSAGTWLWEATTLAARQEYGAAIWLLNDEYEDFELRAEFGLNLNMPAHAFGLVLRAGTDGDEGIFATCIPGRHGAELVKYEFNHPRGLQSLWRGRETLQTHYLAPSPGGTYLLRVIAYGPSLEVNVNHQLVLATMSMPRRGGRVGLFLEDGAGTFSNITLQPLRAPECNWEYSG